MSSAFHILDLLAGQTAGHREATCLQNILLKHFEGAVFKQGRIKTNVAQVNPSLSTLFFIHSLNIQVPKQPNANDCGCFLIYFTKRFFSNPQETLTIIKVTIPINILLPCWLTFSPKNLFLPQRIVWWHGAWKIAM